VPAGAGHAWSTALVMLVVPIVVPLTMLALTVSSMLVASIAAFVPSGSALSPETPGWSDRNQEQQNQ
jgi:hypothetical protein